MGREDWKGRKTYGIGTEMGISPGDSRGSNHFPLTKNGYTGCLLLLCSALLHMAGLLPRPDVCIC